MLHTKRHAVIINSIKKQLSRDYSAYIALVLFVSALLVIFLKLWEKDLRIPFSYMIDAFGPLKEVKNAVLGNGLYSMPQVAAPLGGDETRAIKGFIIHHLFLKVLAYITGSAPLSVNLYYLISYPLTAALSFFSMKKIGLGRISSFVLSVLYAFLPYHFYKSTYHLYLACYYLIPLACLVIFDVAIGDFGTGEKKINRQTLLMMGVSLLLGLSDTYYAAFYCIILLFASVHGSIQTKNLKSILWGMILSAITMITAAGAIAPMIYTSLVRGGNVYSGLRGIYDVELYSIKLAQLILPIHGHRIAWLNDIRVHYEATSMPAHEGAYVSLGIIMSLGFITAIVYLFVFKKRISHKRICLSRILLFIFILSTVGGIDSFIGIFVTASIRTYARVIVFLAFFAACSAGLYFDILLRNKHAVIKCVLTVSVLILGLLDQISPQFSRLGYYEAFTNGIYLPYDEIVGMYQDDAQFVQKIEELMPQQAMILELPIVYDTVGDRFPNGATGAIGLQRPYLHSHSTVWSCASQRGDDNDRWLGKLSRFSYGEMLDLAVAAGFQGLYIDTTGYTEEELANLTAVIDQKTNVTAISNQKGDLLFYNLAAYAGHMKGLFSKDEFADYSQAVLKLHLLENERIYYPETSGIDWTENCSLENEKLIIPPGGIQFGPYHELESGKYQVFVLGENLTDAEVSVYIDNAGNTIYFQTDLLYQESGSLSYEFELAENTPDLEFTLKNTGGNNCVMNHIFLVRKDSTGNDQDIIRKIQEFLCKTQSEAF